MGDYRAALTSGASSVDVRQKVDHIAALLDAADRALSPEKASAASSFLGAMTILLREGMEALLIVVAMIAFLRKAERTDVLPYVHAGWISALAAGALTWAAATYLISISGASRELTEGFGSLVSAVVLISVGVWMHGKGQADAWQAYIRDKLSVTLSKTSAWFLFLLAFIVVYREVFETILFYVALWSQGGGQAMLAGAGVASVALAVVAWALLNFSKRLPISKFFSYSSILIAILAVVLAGKGVAALQEAGLLDIRPLATIPRIELLGVFPTLEGLVVQLLTIAAIVVGFPARAAPIRSGASPIETCGRDQCHYDAASIPRGGETRILDGRFRLPRSERPACETGQSRGGIAGGARGADRRGLLRDPGLRPTYPDTDPQRSARVAGVAPGERAQSQASTELAANPAPGEGRRGDAGAPAGGGFLCDLGGKLPRLAQAPRRSAGCRFAAVGPVRRLARPGGGDQRSGGRGPDRAGQAATVDPADGPQRPQRRQ